MWFLRTRTYVQSLRDSQPLLSTVIALCGRPGTDEPFGMIGKSFPFARNAAVYGEDEAA